MRRRITVILSVLVAYHILFPNSLLARKPRNPKNISCEALKQLAGPWHKPALAIVEAIENIPGDRDPFIDLWAETLRAYAAITPGEVPRILLIPELKRTMSQIRDEISQPLAARAGAKNRERQQKLLTNLDRLLSQERIVYEELWSAVAQGVAFQDFRYKHFKTDSNRVPDPLLRLDSNEPTTTLISGVTWDPLQNFPAIMYVPIMDQLGFHRINQFYPFGVILQGITSRVITADGVERPPQEFLDHDITHALGLKDAISKSQNPETLIAALAKSLPNRIRLHTHYEEIRISISDKRVQFLVDAVWFEMFHERYLPYERKSIEKFLKGINSNIGFPTEREMLLSRLNDKGDFGQAFKGEVTRTELDKALEALKAISARTP